MVFASNFAELVWLGKHRILQQQKYQVTIEKGIKEEGSKCKKELKVERQGRKENKGKTGGARSRKENRRYTFKRKVK